MLRSEALSFIVHTVDAVHKPVRLLDAIIRVNELNSVYPPSRRLPLHETALRRNRGNSLTKSLVNRNRLFSDLL